MSILLKETENLDEIINGDNQEEQKEDKHMEKVKEIVGPDSEYETTPALEPNPEIQVDLSNINVDDIIDNTQEKAQNEVDKVTDAVITSEIKSMDEASIASFLNSSRCKTLIETGKLSSRSVKEISKATTNNKRQRIAEVQLAIEDKSPLAKALAYVRLQENKILNAIHNEYGSRATKVINEAQEQYRRYAPKYDNLFK